MAVIHASQVINWQANLSDKELPPEWMWSLDEELEGWFDDVVRKRKERYGIEEDEDEEDEMMGVQNEYAAAFRKGRR